MIVNSLKNSANGGAPVIATAPASHKKPSVGSRFEQMTDAADALRAVGSHDDARAEKHRGFVQRVIEHVVQCARNAERPAEAKPERDDSHVLDARIGHEALDPRLADDE